MIYEFKSAAGTRCLLDMTGFVTAVIVPASKEPSYIQVVLVKDGVDTQVGLASDQWPSLFAVLDVKKHGDEE